MHSTLESTLRNQLTRRLVQQAIVCPIGGDVLDVRTVIVLNDTDGDPKLVLSPTGWETIQTNPDHLTVLAARGLFPAPVQA